MHLRDIFLFAVIAILVLRIPARPYIGALAWVVFSLMNPQRLTWGPAYDFPFSLVIALATLVGMLITKDHRQIKGGAPLALLFVFFAWTCVTTVFALEPQTAVEYLIRVSKIYFMTVVLLMLLHTRRHVDQLVWCMVLSMGFFGVKGGIFTIATGAQHIVNGPPDSMVAGRNALAVALIVVIPLMVYLHQTSTSRWIRRGLIGAIALCAISVLGSYSRGGMVAIAAMAALLWLRGKNKATIFVAIMLAGLVALPLMPEQWTYDEDASAVGRLVGWETAYNIAKDRFPVAGGFEWQSKETSARYSPVPSLVIVAHSIYFQVLGSQGFVGLTIWLLFWVLVWRQCAWIRRKCRGRPEEQWAHTLASMVQVAMVGYLAGGAFLDLAFWDLPYYLFAVVVVTRHVLGTEIGAASSSASAVAMSGTPADLAVYRRISVATSNRSP
jgi:putative inorganic carbon (hco3(-)) transporter